MLLLAAFLNTGGLGSGKVKYIGKAIGTAIKVMLANDKVRLPLACAPRTLSSHTLSPLSSPSDCMLALGHETKNSTHTWPLFASHPHPHPHTPSAPCLVPQIPTLTLNSSSGL